MKKYVLKQQPLIPQKSLINYKKELNEEQFSVVTTGDGAALVLAGAGSGKTRTLVYRVAYLIEAGVPADRILLMTFTNKAAKEMLSRVEELLRQKPKGLWGGTFHHIGNRILRMYGKHIDLPSNFTILDSEDAKDLMKSCYSASTIPKDKYFPKAEVIRHMIGLSANLNQPLEQIVTERYSYIEPDHIPTIKAIAEKYQSKKQASSSLDFDDLLTQWNRLLVDHEPTRTKLSRKFQYILVDEYQDTNYIQGELIKNLGQSSQNILAVGDDSQSIYSFRGATVNNILEFPNQFKDSKIFKLETNYRSTPEILTLANASIQKNQKQFEKQLKTSKPKADKPVVVPSYDNYQQADFITQRILELHQEEGISLNDIVILYRAHFQSLELEMECNKRGIPYDVRGGLRFFEQAHIKDTVAHLKAYVNTKDEIAWNRLLKLQPGVGPATAQKVWRHIAQHETTTLALANSKGLTGKAALCSKQMQPLMHGLSQIPEDHIGAMIEYVLQSGYSNYVRGNFDNATDRIEDLNQLITFASSYNSLDQFLADIALNEGFKGQTVVTEQEGPNEAVTLSTVHQAKGLEWKVVFVIGLTDGGFPHAKVFDNPEQLEEERRLFYVACTRAKDQLYLTYPTITNRGDIITRPSQFITELPQDLYTKWGLEEESSIDYDHDDPFYEEDTIETGILDKYFQNKKRQR